MFYLVKSPWLLRKMYADCIWKIDTEEKILFLTFDDGPHPQATSFVLDALRDYDAFGTFFCIGKNVEEHRDVYNRILEAGHRTGNHTYDHLNGWKTEDSVYLKSIVRAGELIDSDLFRPPYGRISKFQLSALKGERFKMKTVMWSVLSGDFDVSAKPENCYLNVVNHAKPGSIVVFHDSMKAFSNLRSTLPKVLEHYSRKGYRFAKL